jgi:hypothetical protein
MDMKIPYFPDTEYLRGKSWHRLFKVIFILWLIFAFTSPIRFYLNGKSDCYARKYELYVEDQSSWKCEEWYSMRAMINEMLGSTEAFLGTSLLAVLSYFVPIGAYHILIYILVGNKWKIEN